MGTNQDLKFLIRDYFNLPRHQALMPAILKKRINHADLVLCLLHLRDTHRAVTTPCEQHIATLMGHPITTGQPCLQRLNTTAATRTPDDRRIISITKSNPRQPNTKPYFQWREYRVGRSIKQLMVRGITRRDLRTAVKRGWVTLEATS